MATPTCGLHCRVCGGHFTSLEAFDSHRPRNASQGGCEWPDDAVLVEVSGVCWVSDPTRPNSSATLYRTGRADRARKHFAKREQPLARAGQTQTSASIPFKEAA